MGLALSPDGRVFVSRRRDSTVEIYSRTGRLLSVLGEDGLDPGQFNIPAGLAVDASGALYVTEFYGHRVQKFAYP
jgi:DNA-binding beta-propeller fold protein YncE